MYATFNSKFAKLSTIIVYTSTEDAEDDAKNTFYESLQATVEVVLKHDVLFDLGALNSWVGSNNNDREKTMGKHRFLNRLGILSNNGERLCSFCEELGITESLEVHFLRNIHKIPGNLLMGRRRAKSTISLPIINGVAGSTMRGPDVKKHR